MTDKYWKCLLFAGDLHKRHKDISTIEGYVACTQAVQHSLMDLIKEKGIDYFIHIGDWYDKGYAGDIASALVDYDVDIQMSRLLNGNFYGLIGNHIRLSMDSNPELHLIQPHPYLRSRRQSTRTDQIIRTPRMLKVNDVQISFQHYDMGYTRASEYKPTREEWAKYHIALFHTPLVIPGAKLINTAYGYNISSNSEIAVALDGVDLAICGDIHKPLGKFDINKPDGSCTVMIVPGSLTNTDAGDANRHATIMMPLIKIGMESEVSIEFIPFDLQTNKVTFKKKNVEATQDKLKTLRGKDLEQIYSPEEVVAALSQRESTLLSLNAFMGSCGYTKKDKDLVRAVMSNPDDITELVKIWQSEL